MTNLITRENFKQVVESLGNRDSKVFDIAISEFSLDGMPVVPVRAEVKVAKSTTGLYADMAVYFYDSDGMKIDFMTVLSFANIEKGEGFEKLIHEANSSLVKKGSAIALYDIYKIQKRYLNEKSND